MREGDGSEGNGRERDRNEGDGSKGDGREGNGTLSHCGNYVHRECGDYIQHGVLLYIFNLKGMLKPLLKCD